MTTKESALKTLSCLCESEENGFSIFDEDIPYPQILEGGEYVCEDNSRNVWGFIWELRDLADAIERLAPHAAEECWTPEELGRIQHLRKIV